MKQSKASFDDIQQAFIDERITLQQFISILIDNFGFEKTMKILEHNLIQAINKQDPN